ncbi:MAG: hypothetical protein HY300_05745, partial [Verrucomicrobia bacterium]|nr:hypothetical protein [Verrucomicrobiota bacterium]
LRAMVNAGWLVGSVVVLLLWWICSPALWPDDDAMQIVALTVAFGVIAALFRPVERWVSARSGARWWKIATVVTLWQAYSVDWELRLNFLKDNVTLHRHHVQWEHVALDAVATVAGLAWTLWVQRRFSANVESPAEP